MRSVNHFDLNKLLNKCCHTPPYLHHTGEQPTTMSSFIFLKLSFGREWHRSYKTPLLKVRSEWRDDSTILNRNWWLQDENCVLASERDESRLDKSYCILLKFWIIDQSQQSSPQSHFQSCHIWYGLFIKFFVLSHDYFVKTVMSKVCSSLLQLWNGRIQNAFTLKDTN